MGSAPRISILLPLQDERDSGEECMRAWTSAQTAPADSYEVIALAPGEDPDLERSVRPLLRSQDRWIVVPGADEYSLFNEGAASARGDYVFVTEAHCVPEPECLAAMLDELDASGAPGVRGASVPEAQGELGVLERDAFEDALRIEEDPDHWRKVLIHSLAIRRDVYLDAGGLPPRYGDFAPWVLAIALHSRDDRLKFSPRPRVRHVYDGDLEHLGDHVRSFGRGEMRYRAERPAELTDPYLPPAREWDERTQLGRSGALRSLRSGLALRHPGTLRTLLKHAVVAVFGLRGQIVAARLHAAAAGLGARLARDPERKLRRFLDFWRLTNRIGRLEGVAECDSQAAPPPAPVERIDFVESLSGQTSGFFDPEEPAGAAPYRCTEPLAQLRVTVPGEGTRRARLALRPLRPPGRPPKTRVAVDGVRVPVHETSEAIEFDIEPGERLLSFACRAFRGGAGDRRRLGLCLESLSFEPGGLPAPGRRG